MGLLKHRRAITRPSGTPASVSSPAGPAAEVTVSVIEDTHTYAGDEGSTWWSGGYAPVHQDLDGGYHFAALGEQVSDPRVLYCKVAGAHHRPKALQDPRFKPGSAVILRPEPDNPYDADAVGVWDGSGSIQVGYIPADCCRSVASRIRAGEQLVGFVLREIRHSSESGPRSALHLLVMPTGALNLSVIEGEDT
jgi:HIRAN domain